MPSNTQRMSMGRGASAYNGYTERNPFCISVYPSGYAGSKTIVRRQTKDNRLQMVQPVLQDEQPVILRWCVA